MSLNKFSLRKRLKSFVYAFTGLKILLKQEHNAWIHLLAAICVVLAGIYFKISNIEWMFIVFAIGFVFALEIINSAIENLADHLSPGKDEKIKKIKDLSAAAVLVSAITALVIGLVVFLPKVLELITPNP